MNKKGPKSEMQIHGQDVELMKLKAQYAEVDIQVKKHQAAVVQGEQMLQQCFAAIAKREGELAEAEDAKKPTEKAGAR